MFRNFCSVSCLLVKKLNICQHLVQTKMTMIFNVTNWLSFAQFMQVFTIFALVFLQIFMHFSTDFLSNKLQISPVLCFVTWQKTDEWKKAQIDMVTLKIQYSFFMTIAKICDVIIHFLNELIFIYSTSPSHCVLSVCCQLCYHIYACYVDIVMTGLYSMTALWLCWDLKTTSS